MKALVLNIQMKWVFESPEVEVESEVLHPWNRKVIAHVELAVIGQDPT